MANFPPEFPVTLTTAWQKVLNANGQRVSLRFSPVTLFYDAYWSTDSKLDGTTTAGGFALLAGEDFGNNPSLVPKDAIYMRSAGGEVVTVREASV